MHPNIHLDAMPIILAVVASFVFGWIWHGPLFGKTWLKLMNLPLDITPNYRLMLRAMALGLVATFLTSYVLVFSTNVWRPSVWIPSTMDDSWQIYGFMSGFFTWLGFYLPTSLSSVAWEGRSWKLFMLNILYSFFNLQIISMIVAYMHPGSAG